MLLTFQGVLVMSMFKAHFREFQIIFALFYLFFYYSINIPALHIMYYHRLLTEQKQK